MSAPSIFAPCYDFVFYCLASVFPLMVGLGMEVVRKSFLEEKKALDLSSYPAFVGAHFGMWMIIYKYLFKISFSYFVKYEFTKYEIVLIHSLQLFMQIVNQQKQWQSLLCTSNKYGLLTHN